MEKEKNTVKKLPFKKAFFLIICGFIIIIGFVVFFMLQNRQYAIKKAAYCRDGYSLAACTWMIELSRLQNEGDKQIVRQWSDYYDNYLRQMKDSVFYGGMHAYIFKNGEAQRLILERGGQKTVLAEKNYKTGDFLDGFRNLNFFRNGELLLFESGPRTYEFDTATEKETGAFDNLYSLTPDGKYAVECVEPSPFRIIEGPLSENLPVFDDLKSCYFRKTCWPDTFCYYDGGSRSIIMAGYYPTDSDKQNFKIIYKLDTDTGKFTRIK